MYFLLRALATLLEIHSNSNSFKWPAGVILEVIWSWGVFSGVRNISPDSRKFSRVVDNLFSGSPGEFSGVDVGTPENIHEFIDKSGIYHRTPENIHESHIKRAFRSGIMKSGLPNISPIKLPYSRKSRLQCAYSGVMMRPHACLPFARPQHPRLYYLLEREGPDVPVPGTYIPVTVPGTRYSKCGPYGTKPTCGPF
jgi:hypothetical protein